MMWGLPPVLLRLRVRTKDPGSLLPGGKNGPPSEARRRATSEGWSQSPVLPWARRAYETCLSAGSTAGARARLPAQGRRQPRAAAVGTCENDGALTRSCTELVRSPSECIAHNALRAPRMGPWRWRCVRSPAVSPMRCGSFRPPLTAGANGEGRKIRTSDLMHVTHPLWLAELPEGTHSLAPRSGSLARLTFHDWSAWQESHLQPFRLERDASAHWATRGGRFGAPGQARTDTVRGLSPPPLRWATGAD